MTKSWGALAIAAGIACCGFLVNRGIVEFARKDRCVTVKGLSEREVLANRVVWPMEIEVEGAELEPLFLELEARQNDVIAFLKQNSVSDKEIMVSAPVESDRWEYEYDECLKMKKPRFYAKSTVTVTSSNVAHVMELLNKQLELRKKGVAVSTSDYEVKYEYTDLSSLKPEMVEEATKNARSVAIKFAEDAGCGLGGIMSATQGQFSMEEEYYRPQYKKIRVVTTVAYFLK